jgi:hypothetical protein
VTASRVGRGARDAAQALAAAARGPQPASDLRWLCWTLGWRVVLVAAKHVVPLPALVKSVRWTAGGPIAEGHAAWRRAALTRWHAEASPLLPGNCLERSLLVHATWARVADSTHLVVGFRRAGTGMHGHTWVTSAGQLLLEPRSAIEGFQPACVFDADGVVLPARA